MSTSAHSGHMGTINLLFSLVQGCPQVSRHQMARMFVTPTCQHGTCKLAQLNEYLNARVHPPHPAHALGAPLDSQQSGYASILRMRRIRSAKQEQ